MAVESSPDGDALPPPREAGLTLRALVLATGFTFLSVGYTIV